jgi:RNA-binding protein
MLQLSADQCRHLRSLAHHLNPVVMIGNNGLTESVMREIAINLDAHELIKIRVLGDDREARAQLMEQICADLGACPVQHLGKLLLIFRPSNTDKPKILLPKQKKAAK